jgi:serine/threonine-protein kinase
MLTGSVPRDFPPDKDIWHVVLNTDPVPIRFRNPRIPSRLAEVIDLALIDRFDVPLCFPSAAEFKQALQDVM